MENLVNSRFNYLMVILAIIIAGVISAKSPLQARILFTCGPVISLGLGWTILRAQKRFDALIDKIHEDQDHAATFAKSKAEQSCCLNPARYSARKLIGYVFPVCIFVFMFWGSINPNLIFFETDEDKAIIELNAKVKVLERRLLDIEIKLKSTNKIHSNIGVQGDGANTAPPLTPGVRWEIRKYG